MADVGSSLKLECRKGGSVCMSFGQSMRSMYRRWPEGCDDMTTRGEHERRASQAPGEEDGERGWNRRAQYLPFSLFGVEATETTVKRMDGSIASAVACRARRT